MSNIDKIRQEIMRRIENYWSDGDVDSVVVSGEPEELLAFIDSLPEEKPLEDLEEAAEDFVWEVMENDEDGISDLCRKLRPTSKISDFYDALAEFFKAGAEWQKEQDKDWLNCELMKAHLSGVKAGDMIARKEMHIQKEKPSEYMEEAANKFAILYDQGTCDGIAQDCFIAGAEWQAKQLLKGSPLPEDTVLFQKGVEEGKRLIMEDAVDGEIGYWNQIGLSIRLDQSLAKLGYDMDTKVKIIIVKEDDGLHKAEAE